VRWVVRLCQDLGAKVVAEGIETLAELKVVRDAGVDYAQGFLLARPGHPLPSVQWPRLTPKSRPRNLAAGTRERVSKSSAAPQSTRSGRYPPPPAARGAVEEVSEPRSKPPGRLHPQHPGKRPSKRPSGPPGSVRRR
jgi:hypothetical protein